MATKDIPSSVNSNSTSVYLSNVIDPTNYKWHQIIRDKIGYLFFNIASLCTDSACKMHEKATFLKLSIKSNDQCSLK